MQDPPAVHRDSQHCLGHQTLVCQSPMVTPPSRDCWYLRQAQNLATKAPQDARPVERYLLERCWPHSRGLPPSAPLSCHPHQTVSQTAERMVHI